MIHVMQGIFDCDIHDSMEHKENKAEIVPVSVRFDASLHERLDEYVHAKAKRLGRKAARKANVSKGAEIQEAVRRMLDEYQYGQGLESPKVLQEKSEISTSQSQPVPLNYFPFHRELHTMLDAILNSGDQALSDTVRGVMEQLGRMVPGGLVATGSGSSDPGLPRTERTHPIGRDEAVDELSREADQSADRAQHFDKLARRLGSHAKKLRKDGGTGGAPRKRLGNE
jgi:hypothetical protein